MIEVIAVFCSLVGVCKDVQVAVTSDKVTSTRYSWRQSVQRAFARDVTPSGRPSATCSRTFPHSGHVASTVHPRIERGCSG